MKKLVALSVISLIALLMIIPKFAGNTLNTQLDNIVSEINSMPHYQAQLENRNQTWFSTTAEIKVGIDLNSLGAEQLDTLSTEALSFNIPLDAQHGLILTRSGLSIGWADIQILIQTPVELIEAGLSVSDDYIYQLRGNYGVTGTFSFKDKIASGEFTDQEDAKTVSFEEWLGQGQLSSSAMKYAGNGLGIKFQDGGKDVFSSGAITGSYDMDIGFLQALDELLYNGNFNLSLDQMNWVDLTNNNERYTLSGSYMGMQSNYDHDSELGGMVFEFGAKQFNSSQFKVDDVLFSYGLNNISRSLAEAYKAFVASPENGQVILDEYIKNDLLDQLQKEPEFNIPLMKASINGNKIEGFIKSKIVGVTQVPANLADPLFWLKHAYMEAELSADEEAALLIGKGMMKNQFLNASTSELSDEELDQMLTAQVKSTLDIFILQGLINQQESVYQVGFEFKDGKASVNGEEIPLPF